MARILGVGVATLDIINSVAEFPAEDSEVRVDQQQRCRGGNVTNTLVVLSQLGHQCSWAGTLADEPDAQLILADLQRYGVDARGCRWYRTGKVPTSYIVRSRSSGSRTIVHYRDLPELTLSDFERLDLSRFDWLHFEGRNVDEVCAMLALAKSQAPAVPRSVEIEKMRAGVDRLYEYADLLFYAKGFAMAAGYEQPQPFLRQMRRQVSGADLVCAWGERGAWAMARGGEITHSGASLPSVVVDTLGAGDTFNAALIDARLRGMALAEAVHSGCRLAGRKCGQMGFDGLGGLGS
ncbi:MAG: ketohexokinase [Gammaproteobacteria bacterium]|nr:ketohexokinase [Gammaproteobacteria bacterium]